MSEDTELIPPDLKQCQTMKHNGYTFMTLGGRPGYDRCTEPAAFVATENAPGEDGLIGSMSLCTACLTRMISQMGATRHNRNCRGV